mmetsp:Transcript_113404/g.301345  ORF Transcript_113404/g.301345 Transcript_113404/m.301345 type:complete len:191 (-) Transcript_113404:755-1327(-)
METAADVPGDDSPCAGSPCDVCRRQPAWRRLLMEASVARSARELRRSLREHLPAQERARTEAELRDARVVLAEFRRHRDHTPFFKVVARGDGDFGYVSVYDGQTPYVLGVTSDASGDGCFVHPSEEEAMKSIASFPRTSAKWGAPRALLMVRGEGSFQLKHGKVLFQAITPLDEVPWAVPSEARKSTWRV